MRRREFFPHLAGLTATAMAFQPRPVPAGGLALGGAPFNVRHFGASGDGIRLETQAIQKAIDACAQSGGGTVHFPAGTYLSGTLMLKSRVTLHLDAGAVLLGSPKLADYPSSIPQIRSYTDSYTEKSLLYGENIEDISLTGRGVIDGQGAAFKGPYKVRPYLIRLVACRNVSVRDLTIRDSPMWVQHYLACDGVLIDGITVSSRCNANNDGIDIDGCQRVRIANCDISSGDDAIVLKSTLDRPCRDVVVSNCVISSRCNAFKLGTESNGGFENIAVSNCVMYDTQLAGIALELVDGGVLKGVTVSDITMRQVSSPIFIRLGNRARPFKEGMATPGIGSLRHISIRNVQATGANRVGCSITGIPEAIAQDISLDNLHLTFAGGGTANDAKRTVPEHPAKYPEYAMFGTLPAYGFYCRHAKGLRFSNVHLTSVDPDERPSLVGDDVEDLELFGWHAASTAKANPVIQLTDVRSALIHGCHAPRGVPAFLRVTGRASAGIKLAANEFSGAAKVLEFGPDASKDAAAVMGAP